MLHKLTQILIAVTAIWSIAAIAEEPNQKAQLDIPAAEQQCTQGHLGACMRLGMHFEKMGKTDQSIKYYQQACEGDDVPSCLKLADAAEASQDQKAAMHWLRRACRSPKGDGFGCYRIGNYALAMKSEKNAKTWFKKACEKGHSASCSKQK